VDGSGVNTTAEILADDLSIGAGRDDAAVHVSDRDGTVYRADSELLGGRHRDVIVDLNLDANDDARETLRLQHNSFRLDVFPDLDTGKEFPCRSVGRRARNTLGSHLDGCSRPALHIYRSVRANNLDVPVSGQRIRPGPFVRGAAFERP